MESYVWLLVVAVGVLLLELGSILRRILRSLQSTEDMMKRFLTHSGVGWEAAIEPSPKVRELAVDKRSYVAAIKAYREQTGLGLKEAKAVIDDLARQGTA